MGELKSKKSYSARKVSEPIIVFFEGDLGKELHSSFSYLRSLKPEKQDKIGITGNGQPGRNFKKFLVDTLIPGLGDGEGSEGNMRTQKKEKKNFTTGRMEKMNKLSVEHCKGIIEQRLTELGVNAPPPPPPQAEEVEEEELEREEDDAKNESGDVRDEKETRQETELGTWKSRTNSKAKNTGGSEEESDLDIMTNLLDNDNAVNYALLCSNLRKKLETFWSTFPRMIDADLPLDAAGATCNQIEQSLMNFFTQVLGPKDVELAMFNPFIFGNRLDTLERATKDRVALEKLLDETVLELEKPNALTAEKLALATRRNEIKRLLAIRAEIILYTNSLKLEVPSNVPEYVKVFCRTIYQYIFYHRRGMENTVQARKVLANLIRDGMATCTLYKHVIGKLDEDSTIHNNPSNDYEENTDFEESIGLHFQDKCMNCPICAAVPGSVPYTLDSTHAEDWRRPSLHTICGDGNAKYATFERANANKNDVYEENFYGEERNALDAEYFGFATMKEDEKLQGFYNQEKFASCSVRNKFARTEEASSKSLKTRALDENCVCTFTCHHHIPLQLGSVSSRDPEHFKIYDALLEGIGRTRDVKNVMMDIGCKYPIHMLKRVGFLAHSRFEKTRFLTNWFHGSMHKASCRCENYAKYKKDTGYRDGENVERLWAMCRRHWSVTRNMTARHRESYLCEAFDGITRVKDREFLQTLFRESENALYKTAKIQEMFNLACHKCKPENVSKENANEYVQSLFKNIETKAMDQTFLKKVDYAARMETIQNDGKQLTDLEVLQAAAVRAHQEIFTHFHSWQKSKKSSNHRDVGDPKIEADNELHSMQLSKATFLATINTMNSDHQSNLNAGELIKLAKDVGDDGCPRRKSLPWETKDQEFPWMQLIEMHHTLERRKEELKLLKIERERCKQYYEYRLKVIRRDVDLTNDSLQKSKSRYDELTDNGARDARRDIIAIIERDTVRLHTLQSFESHYKQQINQWKTLLKRHEEEVVPKYQEEVTKRRRESLAVRPLL